MGFISPYIYLLIPTSVCPIYMFKPYKTIHFLKPLLEGVHLEKSKFDLVHFPGISGHFRLVFIYKSEAFADVHWDYAHVDQHAKKDKICQTATWDY